MADDAVRDLLEVCEIYIVDQLALLHALDDGADPVSFGVAAHAQLDQLMTAVDQVRPRRLRPGDPGQ